MSTPASPYGPYWLRLDHDAVQLPMSALYIPRTWTAKDWPPFAVFVGVPDRDADMDLPIVEGLALDIADPAGVRLLAVTSISTRRRGWRPRTSPVVTHVDIAAGRYTEPSTRAWRAGAHTLGLMILVIGNTLIDPLADPTDLLAASDTRWGIVALTDPPA